MVDGDFEAARSAGHEDPIDIPIAAQRFCCGLTVLLGGASYKVHLSLSN